MIILKTPEEIALMREAGRRLAAVLNTLETHVREGVTTKELDQLAHRLITARGDKPAFLNYSPAGARRPYPATICASVNESVVHGLPSDRPLVSGDVLKIDIGLIYKGWHADMARSFPIGKVDGRVHELLDATREALDAGIAAAEPGRTFGDIGHAIQSTVEQYGFTVVKGLTGHGIGRRLHEDPYVYNEGRPGQGEKLVPGMVLALEPMTTLGKPHTRQHPDDSFVTADGSVSAHFEHTVAITERGPEVLTQVY